MVIRKSVSHSLLLVLIYYRNYQIFVKPMNLAQYSLETQVD